MTYGRVQGIRNQIEAPCVCMNKREEGTEGSREGETGTGKLLSTGS